MMGMIGNNKKLASVILGTPDGEIKEQPEVINESEMALDSVAEKLLEAIDAKDKKAIVDALKDFMTLHESIEEPMETEIKEG